MFLAPGKFNPKFKLKKKIFLYQFHNKLLVILIDKLSYSVVAKKTYIYLKLLFNDSKYIYLKLII